MAVAYASPREAIMARLSADTPLLAITTGGVWARQLKRGGDGATATAFEPVAPFRLRPSVVVPDDGEEGDPTGARPAYLAFPTVWLYAPPTASGKDAIAAAVERVRTILVGWSWTTRGGAAAEIERIADRLGIRDDPVLDGAVVDRLRLQVSGLWTGVT